MIFMNILPPNLLTINIKFTMYDNMLNSNLLKERGSADTPSFPQYKRGVPQYVYLRLYKNTRSSDTSTLSSVSRKYDELVGTLPAAQNGDKIFKGWYTARSGGKKVSETIGL